MYLPMSANRKMNYRDNLYKTNRMQKDCSKMIYKPVRYKVVDWNLDLLHLLQPEQIELLNRISGSNRILIPVKLTA